MLIHRTVLAVVAAMGLSCATALAEGLKTVMQIRIEPQAVSAALLEFSDQTKLQVVSVGTEVRGLQSPGVEGEWAAGDALTRLLKGTGLGFELISDKTVRIFASRGQERATASGIYGSGPGSAVRLAQGEAGQTSFESPQSPEADSAGAADSSQEETGTKLEEIVVTAQKRQERLHDVPIAISVLSGEDLDRSTAQGVTEALNRVPGVATTVYQQGGETLVTVRGVGVSLAQFNGASPIAYYLDSVPFGFVKSAVGPDTNVYDLERVEVLRGPQGTLYGASALNGVVRVLTQDADLDELQFKARTTLSSTDSGGENYRGDMAVNVPLISGKLAARAVAGYESLSGWIDRPSVGRNNANDSTLKNARLKIGAQPIDKLSLGLSAWLSRSEHDQLALGISDEQSTQPISEPAATDYDVYGLEIGYDFPGFAFAGTTSYLDYQNGSNLSVAARPLFTGMSANVFAQEVTFNSTLAGAWRWSLGGIYRDAEDRQLQTLPDLIPAPIDFSNRSESVAVFGELTRIFLAGKLELTAGLRYFEDDVTQHENIQFDATARPLIHNENTFHASSPRVILTWHPREQLTIYGSYAEGFRSGFDQDPDVLFVAPGLPPVKPDTVKNYELGAKSGLLGGRFGFDAAVFYIDWDNVQQSLSIPFEDTFVTAPINGDSAGGVGFEAAVTVRPMERLELGVNFSWNDLGMDTDVLSDGVVLFAKGDRLNYSPETTAGVSADYSFPLGGGGYEGRLSASANYTSERAVRSVVDLVPTVWSGDDLTYVRTGFSIDSSNRWSATLFAENLNNEDSVPIRSIFGNPNRNVHMRPRTIGLQFEYRW